MTPSDRAKKLATEILRKVWDDDASLCDESWIAALIDLCLKEERREARKDAFAQAEHACLSGCKSESGGNNECHQSDAHAIRALAAGEEQG